jgi:nucleotide-binding universal stress UspA family protein
MTTIKSILYPTDFSGHSQVAIPLVIELANRFEAEVHCLHVVDADYDFFMAGGYTLPAITPPPDVEHLRGLARDHLDGFVNQHLADVHGPVRKAVVLGKPFERIINYARQESVDLIVIGTHGHSALGSMLLGSVAEKVIRKAPCPVLSIRHPEHVFQAP